jgi:hypothetical protein
MTQGLWWPFNKTSLFTPSVINFLLNKLIHPYGMQQWPSLHDAKSRSNGQHTDQTHIVPLWVGKSSTPINWLITPMVAQSSDYEQLWILLGGKKSLIKYIIK